MKQGSIVSSPIFPISFSLISYANFDMTENKRNKRDRGAMSLLERKHLFDGYEKEVSAAGGIPGFFHPGGRASSSRPPRIGQ